jgi:hypothetical protein
VNIGEPWPDLDEAEFRVREMQTKLHQWATSDPGRRFDDLYNLVYDPAFLVVAWSRVRDNKGGRSAGVDGVVPRSIEPRMPSLRFTSSAHPAGSTTGCSKQISRHASTRSITRPSRIGCDVGLETSVFWAW